MPLKEVTDPNIINAFQGNLTEVKDPNIISAFKQESLEPEVDRNDVYMLIQAGVLPQNPDYPTISASKMPWSERPVISTFLGAQKFSPREPGFRPAMTRAAQKGYGRFAGAVGGGLTSGPTGAGALGALGSIGDQFVQYLSREPGAPKYGSEIAKRGLRAGAEEAALDIAGIGAAKVAETVISASTKALKLIPGVRQAIDGLNSILGIQKIPSETEKFADSGILFRASDQRASQFAPITKMTESIGQSAMFSGRASNELLDERNAKAAEKYIGTIAERIGNGVNRLSQEEAGNLLLDAASGRGEMFRQTFKPVYSKIDEMAGGAKASTTKIKKFISEIKGRYAEINNIGTSPALKELIKGVEGLNDNITFTAMMDLESNLLKQINSLNLTKDVAEGVTSQVTKLAKDALTDPKNIQGAGEELTRLYMNASRAYRSGKEVFNDTLTKTMVKAIKDNPSNYAKYVFPLDNPTAIRRMRNALTTTARGAVDQEGKVVYDQLRRTWIEGTMQPYIKDGVLDMRAYYNSLGKISNNTLKEIFPEKQALSGFNKIKELAGILSKKRAKHGLIVAGSQSGGLIMTVSGPSRLGGATLVIAPEVAAKLTTSERGIKLLSDAYSLPRGSEKFPAMAERIRLFINEQDTIEEKILKDARDKAYRDVTRSIEWPRTGGTKF